MNCGRNLIEFQLPTIIVLAVEIVSDFGRNSIRIRRGCVELGVRSNFIRISVEIDRILIEISRILACQRRRPAALASQNLAIACRNSAGNQQSGWTRSPIGLELVARQILAHQHRGPA